MIRIDGFFSEAGSQAASGAAPVIQAQLDETLARAEVEMQRTILLGLLGVAAIALVAVYLARE